MKKYNHPIDDFFRDGLKDHQMTPSDEAKKAFMKDAIQVPAPEKKRRRGLILFSALLALAVAGSIFWAITSDKFTSNPDRRSNAPVINFLYADQKTGAANKNVSDTKTQQNQSETILLTNNNQQTAPPSSTQHKHQHLSHKQQTYEQPSFRLPETIQQAEKQITQASEQTYLVKATEQQQKPEDVSAVNPVSYGQNEMITTQLKGTSIPPYLASVSHANHDPDSISNSTINKQDSIIKSVSGTKEKTQDITVKNSRWIPCIGIYYAPEWMFNTLEGTKFVNNFGIEGTFHFDRFSVRTGAGFSIAKGTNELVVEYNDFLGAFNKLDSMDFTWNDPAHNFIPTMYMSKKDVWDSLMKLEYARVVKRYTYIQIPMIMGYDFWQSDRISIGVRMGPVLSILVTKKQLSAAYDPGTKRIISINDIAPEQVSLNWQVMAGINTSIRLTKALQFEVEPSIRYYFNSVYEKPANNTKPWSIGVRAAFVVKF